MKTRPIRSFLLVTCLPLLACATEEASPASMDEAPYAYRDGARSERVDAGPGDETLSVDWRGVPAFLAQNQAEGSLVLASLETLFASFMSDGKIVDIAKLPAKNADDMAVAIAAKMCAGGVVTHTIGSAFLIVDFGQSCTLRGSGQRASGTLLVGVTASTAGTAWAAVDLTFGAVGLDGYTLDGHATISTDGLKDTLDTRVSLAGLGTIVFRGAVEGDSAAVSVEGTGSWTGAELAAPEAPDGWKCVSSRQSTLDVRKLRKAAADCYANSGSIGVITPFLCSRSTGSKVLVSTSSVTFLATTPAARGVTVAVSVPAGSTSPAAATTTAVLPQRTCD